jgi:nitrate/nitrite transporter NarK
MLAREAPDHDRTRIFARYSLIGGLSSAAGALAAAAPTALVSAGISNIGALKAMFYFYAALGLVAAGIYRYLPHAQPREVASPPVALGPSKGIVYKLAALFSLDAFAGGFAVQSLVALWLFERFGLSLATASLFFFWSSVLAAFSYPVAARLANRFGLVNTMVFTHIRCRVFDEPLRGARPTVGSFGALADGRPDTHLIRDGCCHTSRATCCRKRHCRAPQPCIVA